MRAYKDVGSRIKRYEIESIFTESTGKMSYIDSFFFNLDDLRERENNVDENKKLMLYHLKYKSKSRAKRANVR